MKAWYENLIGREVTYVNSYGVSYKCIVANMDYNLGLTLQAKNDPFIHDGTYIYCYRGPLTPLNGKKETWRAKRDIEHRKLMTLLANGIKKGIIMSSEVNKEYDKNILSLDHISPKSCSFAQ